MALKFVQTGSNNGGSGNGSGTYDHNLLVNRGMPDQHTIESVTGLRTALEKKYEKPFSGIPKSDLAFNVATLHDIDVFRNTDLADVANDLASIVSEVYDARGGLDTLKNYIDTKVPYSEHSGGSGGGGHLESQVGYPIYEEYKALDFQKLFVLSKTFQMGTHQLEVYVNGLRMIENDDYIEKDNHTVEFLFELEEGDLVLFTVRAVINSGLHEEHISVGGQTSFVLQNPYGIHQNILQVFRNGNLVRKGRDYREVDDRTIEFMMGLQPNEYITFHQSGATDPIAGTIIESELGRMKINHGQTTLLLQEATKSAQTDYIDMYVDSFISDKNIDESNSSSYTYQDESIEVGDLLDTSDTLARFKEGAQNDVDITTYPDTITLKNLPGGAEINTFKPFTTEVGAKLNEVLSFMTSRRSKIIFYAEETAPGQCILRVKSGSTVQDLNMTDGHFFSLSADEDSRGHIHLVYHEQGGASGRSRVHYLELEGMEVVGHQVVSDQSQDAITPDVTVDSDDSVHIVFASKRVNATYFNIDYRIVKDQLLSGLKDVTIYDTSSALNPRAVIGNDKRLRIVFESMTFDNTTKNIRYVIMEDGIRKNADWITHSTSYPNLLPDIDIDEYDNAKIVWKSKRLTTEFGIDYCEMTAADVVSGVKSIATGSFTCDAPKVSADYEGVAHVIFHSNASRADTDGICYAYVRPDGSVSDFITVALEVGSQFRYPDIQAQGDALLVSFTGDMNGYEMQKSLANYTGIGRFDYIFDAKAEGSAWHSIVPVVTVPTNTSYDVEYRVSDDKVIWSAWGTKDSMPTDAALGRYIHLRLTLRTTDVFVAPVVEKVSIAYRPGFIEVQSLAKTSTKEVDSAILIAKYQGDITFQVSRDAGTTFVDTDLEKSVNLLNKPQGNQLVVKAKIKDGSRLEAWGILW